MTLEGEALCPACGGTAFARVGEAREMFGGEPFALDRCLGCGLLRTADDLDAAQLAAYYRYAGGADAGQRFVSLLEPLMRALRRARLAEVRRGCATPGRILDVGCGRGVMLAALAAEGWQVWGTEVDEAVAASARGRLGDRIFVGPLEELDWPPGSFDRVTFWHVLEHLQEPAAALARAEQLLAPGGAVIVALPNSASWQARLGGRHWLHLDVPRHRWHFSPVTLGRLAARVGLRLERVEHFSLEYGPYGLFQSLVARAGLGHFLFTDVLRPTPGRSWALLGAPLLWAHGVLAGPLVAAAFAALPLELLAALAGAGGAITATLVRARA